MKRAKKSENEFIPEGEEINKDGQAEASNVQGEPMTTLEDEMDEANKPSPVPSRHLTLSERAAERKRIFWEKVQAKNKR